MPLNVQTSRFGDAFRKRLGIQGHVGLNLVDDVFLVAHLRAGDRAVAAA